MSTYACGHRRYSYYGGVSTPQLEQGASEHPNKDTRAHMAAELELRAALCPDCQRRRRFEQHELATWVLAGLIVGAALVAVGRWWLGQ